MVTLENCLLGREWCAVFSIDLSQQKSAKQKVQRLQKAVAKFTDSMAQGNNWLESSAAGSLTIGWNLDGHWYPQTFDDFGGRFFERLQSGFTIVLVKRVFSCVVYSCWIMCHVETVFFLRMAVCDGISGHHPVLGDLWRLPKVRWLVWSAHTVSPRSHPRPSPWKTESEGPTAASVSQANYLSNAVNVPLTFLAQTPRLSFALIETEWNYASAKFHEETPQQLQLDL